jgi:branched-chain amino acid transport system permease protein
LALTGRPFHGGDDAAPSQRKTGCGAMTNVARGRTLVPKLRSLSRFTFVDVVLWALRISVLMVVVGGSVGTLIKGRYGAVQWLEFLTFGVTMGSVYALVALGYTMVYGVLRLINFAHGDIMMTGAFSGYFVATAFAGSGFLDRDPVLAMLAITAVAVATSTTIALLTERLAYRPFRHVRGLAPLICAISADFSGSYHTQGLLMHAIVHSLTDPLTMAQDKVTIRHLVVS